MRSRYALAFGLAVAAATITLFATLADAKRVKLRYGPNLYDRNYSYDVISKTPDHGYEGSPIPGADIFCSYHRYPVRKCKVAASGKERCKVVAWRLHQFCTNYGANW